MAALSSINFNMIDSTFGVDKLSYEIFSILENKFLFGYADAENHNAKNLVQNSAQFSPIDAKQGKHAAGKVRILCIDGAGSTDGILAAKSLAHLESCLRRKSGNANASIAGYFDAVAGTGVGGVLAAMLFTRGGDGLPMFTGDEALKFMIDNRRRISRRSSPAGIIRLILRSSAASKAEKLFRKTFGECTLKDTLKPVLIPCYDLVTRAPFVFSRADALEMDGYDFKMRDVCAATSADFGSVEMRSIDGRTKIVAVDGCVAMNNPTAVAITHVLNNKHEFPFCNGVSDLLVLSLGNGESDFDAVKSPSGFVRIAGEGASDMVDQAVSMAFGDCGMSNYVRIQSYGVMAKANNKAQSKTASPDLLAASEAMLAQKNVESVLFRGKKVVENTNMDKLELFGGELIKEQERRKTSILPTVVLKNNAASPSPSRTSSATTLSTLSSSC